MPGPQCPHCPGVKEHSQLLPIHNPKHAAYDPRVSISQRRKHTLQPSLCCQWPLSCMNTTVECMMGFKHRHWTRPAPLLHSNKSNTHVNTLSCTHIICQLALKHDAKNSHTSTKIADADAAKQHAARLQCWPINCQQQKTQTPQSRHSRPLQQGKPTTSHLWDGVGVQACSTATSEAQVTQRSCRCSCSVPLPTKIDQPPTTQMRRPVHAQPHASTEQGNAQCQQLARDKNLANKSTHSSPRPLIACRWPTMQFWTHKAMHAVGV